MYNMVTSYYKEWARSMCLCLWMLAGSPVCTWKLAASPGKATYIYRYTLLKLQNYHHSTFLNSKICSKFISRSWKGSQEHSSNSFMLTNMFIIICYRTMYKGTIFLVSQAHLFLLNLHKSWLLQTCQSSQHSLLIRPQYNQSQQPGPHSHWGAVPWPRKSQTTLKNPNDIF